VSHELLGIKFSKRINGSNIPKKWYIYSFTLVGIKWISQRWNTITSTIFNENVILPVSEKPKIFQLLNQKLYLSHAGLSVSELDAYFSQNT
jgi:hypothetical protein